MPVGHQRVVRLSGLKSVAVNLLFSRALTRKYAHQPVNRLARQPIGRVIGHANRLMQFLHRNAAN